MKTTRIPNLLAATLVGADGRAWPAVQAPDRQRSKTAENGALDIIFMMSKFTHSNE
jgi:hypothetical protein